MAKRDQPERRIQLQIIKYLKLKGFAVGKIKTTGARRGNQFLRDPYHFRGCADLLVFTPKIVFIECKHGRNPQTEEQKDFQELCCNAGVAYVLARSLEDITKIFK